MKLAQHFRREWKKEIKKINDYPETRCVELQLHVCAKDILEEWDKLCEMKEEIRKVVVEVTSFKETTMVTLITLKLAFRTTALLI